jgi:hypothetical protein
MWYNVYRRFGGTYCLSPEDRRVSQTRRFISDYTVSRTKKTVTSKTIIKYGELNILRKRFCALEIAIPINTNFVRKYITSVTWKILAKQLEKNKKFWEELIVYFPWYDTGHIENDASNDSSIVACVFVAAVTFLPSRCLATVGIHKPTHTQTATWSNQPTIFFSKLEK